jgi:hypothetical protein
VTEGHASYFSNFTYSGTTYIGFLLLFLGFFAISTDTITDYLDSGLLDNPFVGKALGIPLNNFTSSIFPLVTRGNYRSSLNAKMCVSLPSLGQNT